MNDLFRILHREWRVAVSKRGQPVWFRVMKWIFALTVGYELWGTRWFMIFVVGATTLGLTVHFVYRWKTCVWTRPWGGWDDLEAGRG